MFLDNRTKLWNYTPESFVWTGRMPQTTDMQNHSLRESNLDKTLNLEQTPTTSISEKRKAFAALAHKSEGDLLRLGRRLCFGNDDRAQDLIQDTLVRAYEAYLNGKFDGGNPRPWLLRILTNLFINDHRRRKKWDAGVDVDTLTSSGETGPVQTHAAPGDTPGFDLLAATLDEELERALASLPEPMRLAIVLVDMEGLDYAEAAKALGVPVGTVRSRLSRARMLLHDMLRDYAVQKGILPSH
jgi:RNA polymerase sigma-70 factor (ECF subfamily)